MSCFDTLQINSSSSTVTEEEYSITLSIIAMHVLNYMGGLPLYSCVMAIILNRRRLDPYDVFVLNQVAAEIVFMLVAPFHILLNVKCEVWAYKSLGFFLGVGMAVRGLLQCCVCLERYVAVIHPVTFLAFRPLRYRVMVCIMAWMGGTVNGIVCMLTYPSLPFKEYGVIYFIILILDIFSCVSILKELTRPGPGTRKANRGTENGAKKQAFQVVVMNMLTFVVQNTPLALLFGTVTTLSTAVFHMYTVIFLAVNLAMGWVQPLIVLHKAGKF